MRTVKLAALLLLTLPVAAVQACSTGCDDATVGRAVAFIDAHQTCETDDDCVVTHDACGKIPGGYCGQLAINRQGQASPEWASISSELDDCAPDTCSNCLALLTPLCTNGCCTEGKCGSGG